MDTNKCINTCLAKKTPKDYRLKPSKSPVESPSCRTSRKSLLSQLRSRVSSSVFFLVPTPIWRVNLSFGREGMCVVCVCVGTRVCACEHNFGVATNHGKFKV